MVQLLAFLAIATGCLILVSVVRIIETIQRAFKRPHRYKRPPPPP